MTLTLGLPKPMPSEATIWQQKADKLSAMTNGEKNGRNGM